MIVSIARSEEHRSSRGRRLGAAAAIFLVTCFFGVACTNEELQEDYDELYAYSENLQADYDELFAYGEGLKADYDELYAYSENLQADYDELFAYSEGLKADYDELYAYSESRESEWVAYVDEMDEFLWRSMMEQSMVRRQDLVARTQERQEDIGPAVTVSLTEAAIEDAIEVEHSEILSLYLQNPASAAEQFEDRVVKLTGVVTGISQDMWDDSWQVILDGQPIFPGSVHRTRAIQCQGLGQKDAAMQSIGSEVTIVGKVRELTLGFNSLAISPCSVSP